MSGGSPSPRTRGLNRTASGGSINSSPLPLAERMRQRLAGAGAGAGASAGAGAPALAGASASASASALAAAPGTATAVRLDQSVHLNLARQSRRTRSGGRRAEGSLQRFVAAQLHLRYAACPSSGESVAGGLRGEGQHGEQRVRGEDGGQGRGRGFSWTGVSGSMVAVATITALAAPARAAVVGRMHLQ